jgi:hypothetical protein
MRVKAGFAATLSALMLAVVGVMPAAAQTNQTGLVNLSISDTTIQLPIALAANVCDVDVAVLSTLLAVGPTQCGAEAGSTAEAAPSGGGGGATNQTGLVNVSISDTLVQVPIAFAINVCDVNLAVLALLVDGGVTDCDAAARSGASG